MRCAADGLVMLLAALTSTATSACSEAPSTTSAAATAAPTSSPTADHARPAPPGDAVASAQPGAVIEGTVLESVTGGNYTYLHLQTADSRLWAAVPQTSIAKGEQVTVERAMHLADFHSPALDRDFELVYFGVLRGAPATAPPNHSAAPTQLPATIAVPKATGPDAFRVAEIVSKAKDLNGKTARVRAMVVRASGSILGRNWLHLRDGSGSADTKDHDLLVTSTELPAVGTVVLATGTVAVDLDLGVGLPFALVLTDAHFTPGAP